MRIRRGRVAVGQYRRHLAGNRCSLLVLPIRLLYEAHDVIKLVCRIEHCVYSPTPFAFVA